MLHFLGHRLPPQLRLPDVEPSLASTRAVAFQILAYHTDLEPLTRVGSVQRECNGRSIHGHGHIRLRVSLLVRSIPSVVAYCTAIVPDVRPLCQRSIFQRRSRGCLTTTDHHSFVLWSGHCSCLDITTKFLEQQNISDSSGTLYIHHSSGKQHYGSPLLRQAREEGQEGGAKGECRHRND